MTLLKNEIAALAPVLEARGLLPSHDTGRVRWHGSVGGRVGEVLLLPVGRMRYAGDVRLRQRVGGRLEVRLSTRLAVKAALIPESTSRSAWLRLLFRWKGMHVLTDLPSMLPGMRLLSHDAGWGQRLLADPAAREALELLHRVAASGASGSVSLVPGWVSLLSPVLADARDLPTRVDAALSALGDLANAAEALPGPERPAVAGPIARWMSANPVAAVLLAFLLALGVLALGGAMFLTIFLLGYSALG